MYTVFRSLACESNFMDEVDRSGTFKLIDTRLITINQH